DGGTGKGGGGRIGIVGSGCEAMTDVVLDFGGLSRHETLEDRVDCLKQGRATAEVAGQVDDAHGVLWAGLTIAGFAVEESHRLGQPEAVDALLDVPHAEQVGRALPLETFGAGEAQDRILDFVDVLVFVDQYMAISAMAGSGDLRGAERGAV